MTILTFPTLAGVAFPVLRTPEWNTDVQKSISGKKTTLGRYIYPIYHYVLSFDESQGGFLRNTAAHPEYQTLLAFFNSVGGRRDIFQFNDTDDNTATAQNFGTGDGVTTQFQLTRTFSAGGFSWTDPVFNPLTITNIFDNGTPVAGGNYSVSGTGLVTFNAAPVSTHALTWTGTYTWLCRFEEDTATFEKFMYWLVTLKTIKFETEKI